MNFTCNTCSLSFPTPEDQRSHMKSDWHRYNLKRRVAQLPCIDEDIFTDDLELTIPLIEAHKTSKYQPAWFIWSLYKTRPEMIFLHPKLKYEAITCNYFNLRVVTLKYLSYNHYIYSWALLLW